MSRLNSNMHCLLTEPILNALFSKNIYTIGHFLQLEIKQIAFITNLSHKDVLGIRNHLINKNSAVVRNGLNYYEELLEKTAIISSGIYNVDTVLQGGFMTGNVYEICGLPGSGKTQFCLTLAKNVVQKLNHIVYYVDTKRDFSGKVICNMLEHAEVNSSKIAQIMSKILVKQLFTNHELINFLYKIKEELDVNGLNLRFIIIDSLPAVFYDVEDSSRTFGILNQFTNILYLLAREYHIVFVITNIITTWHEGDFGNKKNGFTEKIGLGKYWATVPNTRIIIKSTLEKLQYQFTVAKSNKIPVGSTCKLSMTNAGLI